MAFANRTEAYEFDHVIGVICFNTEVKQILPLCESISQFKVWNTLILSYFCTKSILEEGTNIEPTGETALYDALKKASDTLSIFDLKYPLCKK